MTALSTPQGLSFIVADFRSFAPRPERHIVLHKERYSLEPTAALALERAERFARLQGQFFVGCDNLMQAFVAIKTGRAYTALITACPGITASGCARPLSPGEKSGGWLKAAVSPGTVCITPALERTLSGRRQHPADSGDLLWSVLNSSCPDKGYAGAWLRNKGVDLAILRTELSRLPRDGSSD